MKKTDLITAKLIETPSPASAPESPAPAAPVPVLGTAIARAMQPPYRHEPSARTVGWEQPSEGGGVDLFTPTGQFVDHAAKGSPEPAATEDAG